MNPIRSTVCSDQRVHNALLAFSFAGGKRPGKQALRVVLKKSKTGVSGGDEMRNAEIHMNRRLQVFFFSSYI